MADDSVKFFIVSESKPVKIHGHKMEMADLVRFWLETLNLGYRLVNTQGGYVTQAGDYVHEQSYELTVNAPHRGAAQAQAASPLHRTPRQPRGSVDRDRRRDPQDRKGVRTISNCECTRTLAR
jgi:hypothetical protein